MHFTVWAELADTGRFSPPNLSVRVEEKPLGASSSERLLWAALAAHLIKAVESVASHTLNSLQGVRVSIRAEHRSDFPVGRHTIYSVDIYTDAPLACREIDESASEFWAMHNTLSPTYTLSGLTRCSCPIATTHTVARCAVTFQ